MVPTLVSYMAEGRCLLPACGVYGGLSRLEIGFPVLGVDLSLTLGCPSSIWVGFLFESVLGGIVVLHTSSRSPLACFSLSPSLSLSVSLSLSLAFSSLSLFSHLGGESGSGRENAREREGEG